MKGFYQAFLSTTNARASDWDYKKMISGMGRFETETISRFLIFAIFGINRLLAWANDHRTHAIESGDVDFKRQLQIYASLKFLIADLLGIHQSHVPYSQATFAFNFVDKLANLRALVQGVSKSQEADMFKEAYSSEHLLHMRSLLEPELAATDPLLVGALMPLLEASFAELHRHIREEIGVTAPEVEVLERIRLLRRLNHGANLDRDGFARLYFGSKATVPSTIATLPFFMMCAFLCDPRKFLAFRA